jgi:cell wall-associated NlpC family hydrolase
MDESSLRSAVVAEARSWLGTPWRHMGDIKGQCVDCAMFLRMTYINAGVIAPFDPRPYPRLWFLHHDEERFLGWVVDKLGGTEIALDRARPADLLIYRIGRCFAHGSILVDSRTIVHAYHKNREVILTEVFDGSLRELEVRAFDMFASRRMI